MIKSYCKINLSLRVINKLKNGFHNIQTNTVLLNLHDLISIKKNIKNIDQVVFEGQFKKLISKKKNSITNTLKLLKKNNLIKKKNNYKILIKKNIPIFSGLGGGTSNAAYIIKYFLKNKINNKTLNILEPKLGTDLKLFFNNQIFQKNLIKILKYKRKFSLYFTLVYPNVRCSTKEIYKEVKSFSPPSSLDFSKISTKSRFIKLIKGEHNDLQKISISKFKVIGDVINFISLQKSCYFSRMTGSGSVCYGIFKSHTAAKLATKKIKKKFPKYWCVTAKTI